MYWYINWMYRYSTDSRIISSGDWWFGCFICSRSTSREPSQEPMDQDESKWRANFCFILFSFRSVGLFACLFLCLLICLFPFNNKKKKNEWKKKNKKKVFKKKTRGRKKGKKRFVFVSEMDWLIFADLVRGSWDDCIPHDWDRLRKEKKRKSHR